MQHQNLNQQPLFSDTNVSSSSSMTATPKLQAKSQEKMGLATAENNYPGAISAIMLDVIGPSLSVRDTINLFTSCSFFSIFRPNLIKHAIKTLLQAVIDDKVEIVRKLLDKNPALLFAVVKKDLIIESTYTWQRFNVKNKNALSIAAKRKQLEMVDLLLSYCDQLEQTEAIEIEKANALSAWTPFQIEPYTLEEEIVIPPQYKDYMQLLVNACIAENFPYGNGTEHNPDYTHLSDATEASLAHLFNRLLPENAIHFDDYDVDVELLLLTAYKVYNDNIDAFLNWAQRDAFCVRVIGLIQSVLTPEMAKILCEGLHYVVTENRPIDKRAKSLLLASDHPFYRHAYDARSGLGFKYLCEVRGGRRAGARDVKRNRASLIETLFKQKQKDFEDYILLPCRASAQPAANAAGVTLKPTA